MQRHSFKGYLIIVFFIHYSWNYVFKFERNQSCHHICLLESASSIFESHLSLCASQSINCSCKVRTTNLKTKAHTLTNLPVACIVRVLQVSCSTWMCLWERRWQPSAPRLAGLTWCARTHTMPLSILATTTAQSPSGHQTRRKPSSRCSVTRAAFALSLWTRRARESLKTEVINISHVGQHGLHLLAGSCG